jgi:hypothetical protein
LIKAALRLSVKFRISERPFSDIRHKARRHLGGAA